MALIEDDVAKTVPPPTVRFGKAHWRTPVVHDGVMLPSSFGEVVHGHDAAAEYKVGEKVSVQFHGGHPKNNLRIQGTFLEVHRLVHGVWVLHADDGDENTLYEWQRWGVDASCITISWHIPLHTRTGMYRIKHSGDFKTAWRRKVTAYVGFSREFRVVNDTVVVEPQDG